jgi:hypothetical protein
MSELSRLLLKAVKALPPEEQDTVMQELLDARLLPWRDPAAAPPLPEALPELLHRRPFAHPRVELGQVAAQYGPESGGPWQSVPVRLSTEQHDRLKQWCQANGFTMAVVLRGLVGRFLDDQAGRRPPPGGAPGAQPPGTGPAPGSQPA